LFWPYTAHGIIPDSPKKSFVDVPGIDPSIKPGDDFFRYVNGRWYDTAKIADDQTGVGSYSFLNIPQKELLQHILDSVSKSKHTLEALTRKLVISTLPVWTQQPLTDAVMNLSNPY
jgi:putative endopeptidase